MEIFLYRYKIIVRQRDILYGNYKFILYSEFTNIDFL
jgi:hypothetical protein